MQVYRTGLAEFQPLHALTFHSSYLSPVIMIVAKRQNKNGKNDVF